MRGRHPGHSLWNALMLICVGCVLIAIGLSFGGHWAAARYLPWEWDRVGHGRSWDGGKDETITPVEETSGTIPSGVKRLEMELKAASLVIKSGESFSYRTIGMDGRTFEVTGSGDSFRLEEQGWRHFFSLGEDFTQRTVEITIPAGMRLEGCNIQVGAGKVTIDGLDVDRFRLESGAGVIDATGVNASDALVMTGAGSIRFKDCSFTDANFETGAGRIEYHGRLLGRSRVSTGAGSVELALEGSEEDYRIDYTRGIGSVKIDGEDFNGVGDGRAGNRDSDRELRIETGVGSVQIRFD